MKILIYWFQSGVALACFLYVLCFSTLAHVSLYQIQWFLLFSFLFFHPKKYCTGNFLILRVCVIISRKFSRFFFLGNLYHYQNDWMLEVQWERVEGERQWLVCVFRRAANGKITLFWIRFRLPQTEKRKARKTHKKCTKCLRNFMHHRKIDVTQRLRASFYWFDVVWTSSGGQVCC